MTALVPLALAAALLPPLLGWISVAPNRLVSPRAAALPGSLPVLAAAGLYYLSLLGMLLSAWRPRLSWLPEAAAILAILSLAATVGLGTAAALPAGSTVARAAPAAGAWLSLLVLSLALAAAAVIRGGAPALPLLVGLLGLAVLGAAGGLDSLSLVREAAGRAAELRDALAGHVALSLAALLLALILAVPFSALALGRPRLEAAFLTAASSIQVIPSIALFGLLIAPLAALASAFPALRELGLGGIGPAPAILGIAAYLVLPLARGILSGLRVAPADLVEAARGQGLSPAGVLWGLRVPLGAGVMLGALRLAAVQAVGLATLAALVGGGGLGTLVFQGIGQLATDLILLGVLPVLALSLAVDAGLALLARLVPA
ncbi:ABC transporter permease [Muricoccus aerilatus]|uniref:ABC transporter permease n=1 Tax=Muricoccus aerilatus TaxID=452982 RepID=UPI0005C160B9|nr:ABC transporter permease subunit [Roseomonas aerilata]